MTTAFLGAIEAEVTLLREALTQRQDSVVLGTTIHQGFLDDFSVLVACSGVGKVNAALATTALIHAGASNLIFTGVAGGVRHGIAIGDIVISSDCVYHDVDCTAVGRKPGELIGEPMSRNADPELRQRAYKAAQLISEGAQVHSGRIVSGDQFIASAEKVAWLRTTFDAACAEMEGAATAHICDRLAVPFVVVRSISDSADSTAHIDFPAFLQMASVRGLAFAKAYLQLSQNAEISNNS